MNRTFSLPSFLGGAALGILLTAAWFLSAPAPIDQQALSGDDTLSSTTPEQSASGAVTVVEQKAGTSVVVESLTVAPPGVWVAVREVTAGSLGNVLGAVRATGPRANLVVPLLRATEPGRTYAIELYRDDGNGSFDVASDSVYVDFDTGERVVAYFSTID